MIPQLLIRIHPDGYLVAELPSTKGGRRIIPVESINQIYALLRTYEPRRQDSPDILARQRFALRVTSEADLVQARQRRAAAPPVTPEELGL